MIAAKDIVFDNVEIAGPLDLSGADLQSLTLRNIRMVLSDPQLHASRDVEETELIPDTGTAAFERLVDVRGGLAGGRLKIAGRLVLDNLSGFKRLCLDDCEIGGGFLITGTSLPEGISALNGRFGGDVEIGRGQDGRVCVANGAVNFSGADIKGGLILAGLSLNGRGAGGDKGVALQIRGVTIGGDIKFSEQKEFFESTCGSVLIHTTRVSGDLKCSGAFFGGFNEEYFNSLSIYNCSIGGKLVLNRFARRNRTGRLVVGPKGRNRPLKETNACRNAGDGWSIDSPIFPFATISPRIVVFQTDAAIFEVGHNDSNGGSGDDDWSVFEIADRQITLKGFEYERLEESTLDSKVWATLLAGNEPFTGRHSKGCCEIRRLRVVRCGCAGDEPFDPGPWTVAANLLEREGQEDAARKLRFDREDRFHRWECSEFRREFIGKRGFGRLPNLIWKQLIALFIGYGFKPFKAMIHAIAGIALAFTLGVLAFESDAIAPLSGGTFVNGAINGAAADDYLAFDPLTFGFDAFLPIIDSSQTEYWQSTSVKFEWSIRAISFWGWLTFAFGAISFTPLVKRS